MSKNSAQVKGKSNGKAPGDIPTAFQFFGTICDHVAFMGELLERRGTINELGGQEEVDKIFALYLEDCSFLAGQGREFILKAYPDDPRLKDMEENAPDPLPAKMEDRGHHAAKGKPSHKGDDTRKRAA